MVLALECPCCPKKATLAGWNTSSCECICVTSMCCMTSLCNMCPLSPATRVCNSSKAGEISVHTISAVEPLRFTVSNLEKTARLQQCEPAFSCPAVPVSSAYCRPHSCAAQLSSFLHPLLYRESCTFQNKCRASFLCSWKPEVNLAR